MNQSRFALRLFAFLLLLAVGIVWYQSIYNPSTRFQKIKKSFEAAYPIFLDSMNETESNKFLEREKFLSAYQSALSHFEVSKLKPAQQKEWNQIKRTLDIRQEELDRFYHPSLYDFRKYLNPILQDSQLTLLQKFSKIESTLALSKSYYKNAKITFKQLPEPEDLTRAVEKQLLTLNFLQTELIDSLEISNVSKPQRQKIARHISLTKIAVKDYIAFCKSSLFEYNNPK